MDLEIKYSNFIEEKVEWNTKDKNNYTETKALHAAAYNGHPETCEILLKNILLSAEDQVSMFKRSARVQIILVSNYNIQTSFSSTFLFV